MPNLTSPFDLSAAQIELLISPGLAAFPELETARANLAALRDAPQTRAVLAQSQALMDGIARIPQTSYTFYRLFLRNGDRSLYQAPYFLKRTNLAAAVLRLFLGGTIDPATALAGVFLAVKTAPADARLSLAPEAAMRGAPYTLKDVVQDYVWDICEESSWVLPAHERGGAIDLFAAETAFVLADLLALLGDTLDGEVRQRVYAEVDRRVFAPYLRDYQEFHWYQGHHNWNSVCNSSIGAAFLLLEPDHGRVARGLELAFQGLRAFIATAFEEDGSSTEGVAYWHYSLINFVALAELLRARSGGTIDLLDSERVRRIAAYPAMMQLSGPYFASFSDCDEQLHFHPGIVTRLAERTGERSLLDLLARPAMPAGDWRLTMMLRNLLWWDGSQPASATIADAYLPSGGIARLTAGTTTGSSVVLAVKAGHNGENHNQNDVGSFILHVDGENLLTDPGRGLYSRDYFGERRYENIFANSYGHSVPRIDRQLQGSGAEFRGQMLHVKTSGPVKSVQLELARAYSSVGLERARRELLLDGGTAWLRDTFYFAGRAGAVEEALLTWHTVEIDGATALIRGVRHSLRLTIEQPAGATFALERLERECRENAKLGVLIRLSFGLPPAEVVRASLRIEVLD